MDESIGKARDAGYVTTMFGRNGIYAIYIHEIR